MVARHLEAKMMTRVGNMPTPGRVLVLRGMIRARPAKGGGCVNGAPDRRRAGPRWTANLPTVRSPTNGIRLATANMIRV
jgi:hypothetical protein